MSAERIGASSEKAIIQVNCEQALSNLGSALAKPEEILLREHQMTMLQALYDFIAGGYTAGYFSEPTGSGKSVVIVKIAEAMGLKTLILSPTQQILDQIKKASGQFAPELDITNYFANEKNLLGKTINTTYQSVVSLLERDGNGAANGFNPEDIQLVICDEAHLALGEIRHTIHRQFPHALMFAFTATPEFSSLEGFIDRGMINEDERWVEMFRNLIHEMTLEEAMESGILAPVNIHMLKTNVIVPDIDVLSNREYRQFDLERLFATESRNALAIAMVAGVDCLPANITISDSQKKALETVYQKIAGKRTVIFGISQAHINVLAHQLRSIGIGAAAVHGGIPHTERSRILDAHARGEIQIVLGVDLLRLGWDSPATEVGIYLRPTRSGVVKTQELGRILRPSPQTGKKEAIAVEVVDEMAKKWQAPIVFANIFDPEFVLRGTQTGARPGQGKALISERPVISISGMNLETIMEEARMQELLRARFKQADVLQISNLLDTLTWEVQQSQPDIKTYQWAQMIVARLPERIPAEAYKTVLQALAGLDSNAREAGQKAFLLLNLKTILTVVDSFTEADADPSEKDELISEAVASVMEKLSKIRANIPTAQQVHHYAKNALTAHVAQKNGLIEIEDIDKVKTADQANMEMEVIYRSETAIRQERITDILGSLTGRERRVLQLRFGLGDEVEHTLEGVGNEFGVTRGRIQQIEQKALRRLRHPSRSERLKEFLGEIEETHIIAFRQDTGREFGRILTGEELWVERERLTGTLEQIKDMSFINLRGFTAEERDTLANFGIRQLGDFFSAPPDEIFEEANKDLISAAWKVLNVRLADLYLEALDAKPSSSRTIISHVTEAAIYQNSDWAYHDLTLFEIHALLSRSKELMTQGTQQKIFIKAYERLELFLKKL